jgi:hypothetical protein
MFFSQDMKRLAQKRPASFLLFDEIKAVILFLNSMSATTKKGKSGRVCEQNIHLICSTMQFKKTEQ